MRVGGILQVAVNGTRIDAVGSFSWNLGRPKREAMVGHDRVHGYKEMPQAPFLEGEMRLSRDLDLETILNARDVTATLVLATGHVFVLRNAWYAGEGTGASEEGNIGCRFEGLSADLSKPQAA